MDKDQKDAIKAVKDNVAILRTAIEDELKRGAIQIETEIESIEGVKDQLQEKFDEMTEKVQEGERGQKLSEEMDRIDIIAGNLQELKDALDSDFFDDVLSSFDDILGEK